RRTYRRHESDRFYGGPDRLASLNLDAALPFLAHRDEVAGDKIDCRAAPQPLGRDALVAQAQLQSPFLAVGVLVVLDRDEGAEQRQEGNHQVTHASSIRRANAPWRRGRGRGGNSTGSAGPASAHAQSECRSAG